MKIKAFKHAQKNRGDRTASPPYKRGNVLNNGNSNHPTNWRVGVQCSGERESSSRQR